MIALPSLQFDSISKTSSLVQALDVTAPRILTEVESYQLGLSCALFAWMGMSDLHRENIKFGYTEKGKFVFCSIDIETVLDDLLNLGHSGLIPDLVIPRAICGLAEVLEYFESDRFERSSIASFCQGYIETMVLLNSEAKLLERSFCECLVDVSEPPIRVVLRKTSAYVNFLKNEAKPKDFEIPILPCEYSQLSRGDVPYFFRYPSSPDRIMEFTLGDEVQAADLGPNYLKMKLLVRRRFDRTGWDPPTSSEKLLKVGVLQLARAIVKSTNVEYLNSEFDKTRVWIVGDKIFLKSDDGIALSCNRH